MRIAHIIMAHKNPGQLLRMIKKLYHPNFDIYVHVDKKVELDPFKVILEVPNVRFINNRIHCNWGANSFLVAIVSSLKEVFSTETHYDYLNLLSAQDYPLYSPNFIYNYLLTEKGKNFLSFENSKHSPWWKEAVSRYEKYHFTDMNIKGKYHLQKIVNAVMPLRKFPIYTDLYGGSKSTWWTLGYDCAKFLADELSNNKKLIDFIKYSWGTDEFVVATVLMNSKFKSTIVNENLRYIDWSEGNSNPKTFTIEDFEAIKNSGMLFARKFDTTLDEAILDQIDKSQI